MTTITIDRALLEQALALLSAPNHRIFSEPKICLNLRAALSAPATAPEQPERKPMTDQDTLGLFNRIQLRMRFTDADAMPFASGVASAEFFHGIK